MYDNSQIINGCRPMTAGDGNLPSTAVPSGRTGRLTTLLITADGHVGDAGDSDSDRST